MDSSHLELVGTSNSGLLLSKDDLLLGGQVGLVCLLLLLGRGPLGLGYSDRALVGVHGILLHFGAVDVVAILWEVVPIFVYCIAHFKRAALFVFGHVRVLLESEEGDKVS
jgi:hypothetical protein